MKPPPGPYIIQSDKEAFRKKGGGKWLLNYMGGAIHTKNNPSFHPLHFINKRV